MPSESASGRGRRPGRVWGRRVLLVLVWLAAPVLILVAFEGVLRAGGYGQSTRFVYKKKIDRRAYYVVNNPFYFQFLYGQEDALGMMPYDRVIPARKAPGAYRIVLLGGSAAQGWQAWDYNVGRVLLTMLRTAFPETRFELFTAAYYGMNSHVMRHIAQQCIKMDPDLYVVYLGNNETVGPFGLMSVLGRKNVSSRRLDWLIKAHVFASDLRLMQLFGEKAQEYTFRQVGGLQWGFSAPVERMDDPRLLRVYRHYEDNLEAICCAAQRAEAAVALCTVGGNQRDWRPFASRNRADLSDAERGQWNALYESGKQHEERGAWQEALDHYRPAADIDATHAELEFRMGTCFWKLKDYANARRFFIEAGEHGFTFDHANAHITNAVRRVAAQRGEQGVFLVDAAQALADNSPHGIPGREFFYDHMHLRFEGNYVVARAVFDSLAPRLPERIRGDTAGAIEVPSVEACAERMGLSPGVRLGHVNQALRCLSGLGQNQPTEHLYALRTELEQEVGDRLTPSICEGFGRAAELNPDDFQVRWEYVQSLNALRDFEKAEVQARELVQRYPYMWRSQWALCDTLAQSGQVDQAIEAFGKLLDDYPEVAETHYQRGQLLIRAGRPEEALAAFRKAGAMKSVSDMARYGEGQALAEMGDWQGAVRAYCQAIDINPHGEMAYQAMGSVLGEHARPQEAVDTWHEIVQAHPDKAVAQFYLAGALQAAGDLDGALECYRAASEMDPAFVGRTANALAQGASASLGEGELDEAIAAFRAALSVDANHAHALGALGNALVQKGDLDAAQHHYRQVASRNPRSSNLLASYDNLLRGTGDAPARATAWQALADTIEDNALVCYYLGLAWEDQGDADRAAAAFRDAGRAREANPYAMALAGTSLVRLERYRDALEPLETALDKDPANGPNLRPMLIKALCAVGDLAKARQQADLCRDQGIELPEDIEQALRGEACAGVAEAP